MFSLLVTVFGPLAAKLGLGILDAVLKKNKADIDATNAYLALTSAMAKGNLISVDLHDSYQAQQEANKAKAAEEYYRLHPSERPSPGGGQLVGTPGTTAPPRP